MFIPDGLSYAFVIRFAQMVLARIEATALAVEEFEALVFGVHARFGQELVKKLFTEPGVLPLKDANFATTAVPAEKVRTFVDSVAADLSYRAPI